MRCFERRIEKGQQLISQLQVFSNDVFVILSEAPRLLIVAVNGVMIAKKRRQKPNLIRTHQKLAARTADEATHIAAHIDLVLAGLIDEIRRLVHVVPNTCDSVVRVRAMKIAPPASRIRKSEVDKDTVAGPYSGDE